MSILQTRGKKVFLISGGFHCLIAPVAKQLNIEHDNIYANRLKFYFTGKYTCHINLYTIEEKNLVF